MSTMYDVSAFDYFTPNGGRAIAPPMPAKHVCGCDSTGSNCSACTYTFQGMNVKDYDMAVSGVLLFMDLGGTVRLVTIDKAGYGYLLTPGNLGQFQSGDIGNLFPFGAASTLCTGDEALCHRITGMSYFDQTPHQDAWLYYWPNGETLTVRLG